MKPTVLGIVIVLALIAAGAIFYGGSAFAPAPSQEAPVQSYSNESLGMSFTYPVGYVLSEQTGEEGSYHITLIREEDAVPVVGGGEGPVAITLSVFPLADGALITDWLEDSPYSNFGLGTERRYDMDSVSETDAVRYAWSGLYEGITTALVHEGKAYAFSVTFMSPADDIYADYQAVLDSIRLR